MVSEQCNRSLELLLLLLISRLACNTGQEQRLTYVVLIHHKYTHKHTHTQTPVSVFVLFSMS